MHAKLGKKPFMYINSLALEYQFIFHQLINPFVSLKNNKSQEFIRV